MSDDDGGDFSADMLESLDPLSPLQLQRKPSVHDGAAAPDRNAVQRELRECEGAIAELERQLSGGSTSSWGGGMSTTRRGRTPSTEELHVALERERARKEELEEEMLQFSSCYIFGPCVGPQAATCLAKL